jgi:hypothetical protein
MLDFAIYPLLLRRLVGYLFVNMRGNVDSESVCIMIAMFSHVYLVLIIVSAGLLRTSRGIDHFVSTVHLSPPRILHHNRSADCHSYHLYLRHFLRHPVFLILPWLLPPLLRRLCTLPLQHRARYLLDTWNRLSI